MASNFLNSFSNALDKNQVTVSMIYFKLENLIIFCRLLRRHGIMTIKVGKLINNSKIGQTLHIVSGSVLPLILN